MAMKIYIKSNFVVPGLEDREIVDFNCSHLTLRQFLEQLSVMASNRIEYVRPGAEILDPIDWEVEINEVPYQDYEYGLETLLRDGDTVTIRILALGGG